MTHLERAIALRSAGDLAESIATFRLAIKEDPLNPEVWYQTAMAAMDYRDFHYAAAMLGSYVRFQPGRPGPFFDLAYCQMRVADYEGAVRSLHRTIELRPDHPRAQIALGQLLYGLGRPDEAYRAHSAALATQSRRAEDRAVCGIIHLLRGDYPRGWGEFEQRFQSDSFHSVPTWPRGAVAWDGARNPEQTVYIHAEGGFGDTLMFARYFSAVTERAGRVVFLVQPALQRLLARLPGVREFADDATSAPPGAQHASTWSLPHLFGTTLETIPRALPYLAADPAGVRPNPQPSTRLRVGIAWSGNKITTHDLDRSCPSLALLAPLFGVPNVEWTSLQFGEATEGLAEFGIAPCPLTGDFADTADALTAFDLVISVDTAVAHLAGALGVPTWVMVPSMPEFRWLLDRESSPWYPRHRIFRRLRTDDWPGVAERMAPELAAAAAAKEDGGSASSASWTRG